MTVVVHLWETLPAELISPGLAGELGRSESKGSHATGKTVSSTDLHWAHQENNKHDHQMDAFD